MNRRWNRQDPMDIDLEAEICKRLEDEEEEEEEENVKISDLESEET